MDETRQFVCTPNDGSEVEVRCTDEIIKRVSRHLSLESGTAPTDGQIYGFIVEALRAAVQRAEAGQ